MSVKFHANFGQAFPGPARTTGSIQHDFWGLFGRLAFPVVLVGESRFLDISPWSENLALCFVMSISRYGKIGPNVQVGPGLHMPVATAAVGPSWVAGKFGLWGNGF